MDTDPPSPEQVRAARDRLGDLVVRTPVLQPDSPRLADRLGAGTRVHLKLELFQHAGSFKPRGALLTMMDLDDEARARGVTAVSAGNHALAVAYAARCLLTTAKVVMPEGALAFRVQGCRALGAEVVLAADVHQAFATAQEIERSEGRTFVHPFEGPHVALGTGTLAMEFLEQVPDLDALVVPIGGGGLCAGVAAYAKQVRPECQVFGVEPTGADSMHRSFAAGEPRPIDGVRTIADSLGAPYALPYSFELCRRFADDLVLVDDDALVQAMELLFTEAKLAVEPAGAASTAALGGPLRERLAGARVGLLVCGANIDPVTWFSLAAAGSAR